MARPGPPRPDGGYDGPWSNLPEPETRRPAASPSTTRQPLLKRRQGARREPIIRNWKGLAIVAFLLLIAPPLCSWLSRLILGYVQGG